MSGWTEICHPIGAGVEIIFNGVCTHIAPNFVCHPSGYLLHELTESASCQLPGIILGPKFSVFDDEPNKTWLPFLMGFSSSIIVGLINIQNFWVNILVGLAANMTGNEAGKWLEDYIYEDNCEGQLTGEVPGLECARI